MVLHLFQIHLHERHDNEPVANLVLVRRNAYGRQLGSFTTRGKFDGRPDVPMTFVRAPAITDILSPEVEVLSVFDGQPTSVRWRNITAFTWHPELNADFRCEVPRKGLSPCA